VVRIEETGGNYGCLQCLSCGYVERPARTRPKTKAEEEAEKAMQAKDTRNIIWTGTFAFLFYAPLVYWVASLYQLDHPDEIYIINLFLMAVVLSPVLFILWGFFFAMIDT
jgi:hypothetical protein